MQQEQLPRIQFDGAQGLLLEAPHWVNEGVLLEELAMRVPQGISPEATRRKRTLRGAVDTLRCRFDKRYLIALISRTLSGGGLSDLQVRTNQARVEISGLLSREGRRTPFLARGFLSENAGPHGGAIFYDLRLFGRPGLPAPALISLLTARTGRHGPIQVKGAVTLQFDLLSMLFRYGLASAGWKIPSYRDVLLKQLEVFDEAIGLFYSKEQDANGLPLAQRDPNYPYWLELQQAEQTFLPSEELISRGEYKAAIQSFSDELWRHPGHPFLQERLMQLYIASPQQELWNKAYHIAEELLQKSRQSLAALNCLAQYFEGVQDYQTAAHYYTKMGESARSRNEHVEAALSFGKAAELLEAMDAVRARGLWQMAREEDRGYRPAIAALARHALKTGQYDEAEEILRDLIAQTPPSIERARYHLSLAGLYRSRLRDLTSAREQLELASAYLGEDIAYLRELAEFRLATDENIDALRILDRLTERVKLLNQPSLYADLLFRTGQILEERLGRPGQALSRFRLTLENRPNHTHAEKRIVALKAAHVQEEALQTGAFDDLDLLIEEKLRTLHSTQAAPSEEARLHLELSRLYWQDGKPDEAFSHGHEALKLQSSMEEAWELLEEIGLQSSRQSELAAIHKDLATAALFPLDAVHHLEKALRLVPSDTDTFELLSKQYRKMKQWDKLETLYTRWLEAAPPEQAPALWLQKAKLQEEERQQLDGAERSYVQAFQVAENRATYQEALIAFYVRHQLWEKMERQVYHLSQALSSAEEAALNAEKGRQLLHTDQPPEQALDAYQKALMLDPDNPTYLRPAIILLRQTKSIAALVPLLERMAGQSDTKEEEVNYRFELAELLETRLGERERSLEQYKKISQIQPDHKGALLRFAELSELNQEYDAAADAYQKRLALPYDNAREETQLIERLLLLYARLDRTRDLLTLTERLLEVSPQYGAEEAKQNDQLSAFQSDDPTLKRARALILLGNRNRQAGLMMAGVELLQDKHPEEANLCLEAGLDLEPLHPQLWTLRLKQSSPEERKTHWQQIQQRIAAGPLAPSEIKQLNQLFENLKYEGLAFDEVEALYTSFQEKGLLLPPLFQLFATMLEQEDQLEKAIEIRTELLKQMPASPEKSDLRFEVAIQLLQVLMDRERGLAQLWQLLREEPEHEDAYRELESMYLEDGQLEEFATKLGELAQQVPPGAARSSLCIRVFEFYRNILQEDAQAEAFLEQASENKSDVPTLQAIALAYEELEKLSQAADTYAVIGESNEEEAALMALERAGELYMRDLDEPDRAIDFFQKMLTIEPTHQAAIQQLKMNYENLWMWEEYALLLESQAEHASSPKEASGFYAEMAEIYLGRLEDYERALDLNRRSLRSNPRSVKVLEALQLLYEELEDWPAVIAALKALTRNEPDPARLCDLHMKIAELALDRLYKPEETEKHYQLAQEQQPDAAAPLEGLISFFEATEKPDELVQASARLAILLLKNGDKGGAKDALRKMVQANERIASAKTTEVVLRDILQERQESAKLQRKVFDLLQEVSSSNTLTPTFFLARDLYKQELHELAWLLRIYDSEGEVLTEEEADSLIDAIQSEEWDTLHSLLKTLSAACQIPEDRASYELAIAEVALYQRHNKEDAQAHAKEALTLGAPPERAMSVFEELQRQETGTLQLNLLLTLAKELTHPDELSPVLFHLGSSFLLHQNDFASSLQCFMEASMLTPSPLQIGESVRFLYKMKQNDQPGNNQTLPEDLPPLGQQLLYAWMAFSSQDLEQGMQCLEEALKLDTTCSPALRLLGHYYRADDKDHERAAFCFYHFLEREWEYLPFDEVVEVCVQLAQSYARQASWENSLFYLEQAYKFIPEDERIFTTQTQVMKQAGMWEHLKSLYESHLANPEPTDDLAELWYHLGQLHAVHLQNPEEAQLCYQRALQIDPMHTASLQELEELSHQASADAFTGL